MVSSLRTRTRRYNNETEMRHRMLGRYFNKMMGKDDIENKDVSESIRVERRKTKRILLPDIPKRFLREHKELKKSSNPVSRAALISKMMRLYKLKDSNYATKKYAENLLMFIEYVKKDLTK